MPLMHGQRVQAGEPEAAAVAGSEETRLSDGCLPVGRAEAASAAKKAHHVSEYCGVPLLATKTLSCKI